MSRKPKKPVASHWISDPDYPVEDWKYEVSNDDTRLGYAEWVKHQKEIAAEEAGR